MSYSLTINFTPPTGNGYQFVTEYRVKFWPTSSPTNVSTVFTTAFPLVLTDLNLSSYSGTIEAKCGSNYGSPRSFGPIVIAGGGSGGGTTPACPYRVVLYEDESVSYPIGASGNTTGCAKPGYRIKLTTEGGALVTTSTALTVGIDYTVETGDCASPTNTQTISTTLTIPANSSTSSTYLQVVQSDQRISNVSFSTGNPTTLVNGTLTCNLTYVGGSATLPTRSIYLNARESGGVTGSISVQWFLSNSADGMILTNNLLPFNIQLTYRITGTGVSGAPSNQTSTINVSGLVLEATESSTSQGTTAYNWYGMNNLDISFSSSLSPDNWESEQNVLNESGGSVNNPATYVYDGTIYKINIYRNYTLAY